MKLRLKVGPAGIGFSQSPGDEIEVSEAEGARMIAAGQAEAVEAAPAETPPQPPEATPARRPRRKRETAAKAPPAAVETAAGGDAE